MELVFLTYVLSVEHFGGRISQILMHAGLRTFVSYDMKPQAIRSEELPPRDTCISTRSEISRSSDGQPTNSGIVLPAMVIAGMLASGWIALAQPSRLEFEVASVKRNTSPAIRGDMHFESARFVATWRSLRNLIMQAYGVENYQISGFPSFLEDERYDVDGRSAQPASQEELRLMLQTLLADRFSLQTHRESKEMPVYILSVGKNGSKLQVAKESERSTIMLVPAPALGGKTGYQLVGQKIPVGVLTGMLTAQLGRPVLDRTALPGDFSFKADIGPDDSAQVAKLADGQPTVDKAAIVSVSPSAIISAVQADLGLKLESTKAPVEILVIDHAERPAEN